MARINYGIFNSATNSIAKELTSELGTMASDEAWRQFAAQLKTYINKISQYEKKLENWGKSHMSDSAREALLKDAYATIMQLREILTQEKISYRVYVKSDSGDNMRLIETDTQTMLRAANIDLNKFHTAENQLSAAQGMKLTLGSLTSPRKQNKRMNQMIKKGAHELTAQNSTFYKLVMRQRQNLREDFDAEQIEYEHIDKKTGKKEIRHTTVLRSKTNPNLVINEGWVSEFADDYTSKYESYLSVQSIAESVGLMNAEANNKRNLRSILNNAQMDRVKAFQGGDVLDYNNTHTSWQIKNKNADLIDFSTIKDYISKILPIFKDIQKYGTEGIDSGAIKTQLKNLFTYDAELQKTLQDTIDQSVDNLLKGVAQNAASSGAQVQLNL